MPRASHARTSSHGAPAAPAPGTQVLRRSHDMLRLLATHNRTGLRVSDIAQALALEPPTAHRIVQGLVQERMASQDPGTKLYFLGPALCELGITAASRYPLRSLVQPSVERLAKATGDTIVVSVSSGLDSVCIERRSGEFQIQTSMVRVGTRRPLTAGAGGQAIVAAMPDDDSTRWLIAQNAAALERTPEELAARIAETRRNGYASNIYRHTQPPIAALGVAVMGAFGQCVAGFAVVALAMRLNGARKAEIIELLKKEAAQTHALLAQTSLPAGA
jgi:DNA-binding IclR family transcriptional regulator